MTTDYPLSTAVVSSSGTLIGWTSGKDTPSFPSPPLNPAALYASVGNGVHSYVFDTSMVDFQHVLWITCVKVHVEGVASSWIIAYEMIVY